MNVWGRSWLYRLYIVGGIAGIVTYLVISSLNAAPGDDTVLKRGVALVAAWVCGMLLLQGIQLAGDRGSLSQRSYSFAQQGFALVAGLGVLTAFGGVLYVNGVDAALGPLWTGGPSLPVVFVPTVVLTLWWAARVPAMKRKAVDIGNEYLQSLNLEIRSIPESTLTPTSSGGLRHNVRGNTILGGVRQGREVTVELSARGSVVTVMGRLGPITVERRGGAGTDEWLADLAEAERQADLQGAQRAADGAS